VTLSNSSLGGPLWAEGVIEPKSRPNHRPRRGWPSRRHFSLVRPRHATTGWSGMKRNRVYTIQKVPRPSVVDDTLRDKLRHVRWIGGGSGAGKSTVACALAARYSMQLYQCDTTIGNHGRNNADEAPLFNAFVAMDMDDRWVSRSPAVMLATFHGFQGERFDLIVEDLLALADDRPILAEGFRLLPRLVSPLLTNPNQAVWLLPTPQFRRAALDSRRSTWDIPNRTSDPRRALLNLLERDALFTDELRRETRALLLRTIEVHVGIGVDQLINDVAESLDLGHGHPPDGP
jgi:hypothetical protein